MPVAGIRVKGEKELEKAFKQLRREVLVELRPALRKAVEPVRTRAQELAGEKITNIGGSWPQMRTGVVLSGVYVAPKMKRHGGSPRPNLAGLLMTRAMQPALDEKQDEIVHTVEALIAVSARRSGFTFI